MVYRYIKYVNTTVQYPVILRVTLLASHFFQLHQNRPQEKNVSTIQTNRFSTHDCRHSIPGAIEQGIQLISLPPSQATIVNVE
jgi:hypothetical protein